MAYDYSRRFLERHRELADQLEEIYNNRDIRAMVFDRPDDLYTARNIINNILASIALYNPSKRAIRKDVRTWTRYGDGEDGVPHDEKWHLFIGIPDGQTGMRHRVGKMYEGKNPSYQAVRGSTSHILMHSVAKQQAEAPEEGIVHYDRMIKTQVDFTHFIGWAQEKMKNDRITGLKLEVTAAERAKTFVDSLFDGWNTRVVGDTTLLLERAL